MTVKESTICSLIQSFPVFLILAQNAQKCLKTPLVYKPPSPTHSPEYYEALDALFQSLYGHSSHATPGGGHATHGVYGGTHGVYGGSYGSHGLSDPSYHYPDTSLSNCQYSYGKKWVSSNKPCYQYVYTTGNGYRTYGSGLQGYSSYGLKKGNIYALNNVTTSYAPAQVYNTKSRYQVVVKKTKIGKKRSRRSVELFQHGENQNDNFLEQGLLKGQNVVRDSNNGIFHIYQERPTLNRTSHDAKLVLETDNSTRQNSENSDRMEILLKEQDGKKVDFNRN